ncbi:PREDICTED: glutamine-rich protein 2-like [Ficedula albicollis]|uniref:glutamine-rich protein 2-like n=1 Tax=Ficedula albicollis TaxID=59894 RepID=UPI00035A21BA|nr:PREDICTED: glutamine-rich protein 2-like [Ficedula albicollis]
MEEETSNIPADMATSLEALSLSQLLDLAIGAPERGTVHFLAIRKLLEAVVVHLDSHYLTTQEPWTGQPSGPSLADVAAQIKEIKKEIEVYRPEVISQGMAETTKTPQGHQGKDSLYVDFREEIDRIKTIQSQTTQKVKELAALIKKLEEDIKKLRADTTKWKEESRKEISEQLEAMQQEMMQELQKMEEQQEMRNSMLEQLVAETANQLNEQLAEIGEIAWTVQAEQERVKAECSSCTFDINVQLGELLQRCEKLQEQVDSLEARLMAMGKLERMSHWGQKDQGRQHNLEATVVQMQADYEKISLASDILQKDSQEKQKAIEMLFQSLEKLQKEKADEQDMLAAIDVKADKAALGSKVNCSQLEANLERLHERMQDLQSQISGQKQHCNEVQQKLNFVEERKLDRLELKAFSNQMEETWNRNLEELENRLKRDKGAGIKKQLPVPFSCLSCDRMLSMQVPGPYPETLPYLQPLPPSKETRHSQRTPVLHGSFLHVPQSYGDYQSSSSMMQHLIASAQKSAHGLCLPVLQDKPSMTHLLDSSGQTPRGRDDQLPVVTRAQDMSGPAASQDRRPGTAPRHISWAPGPAQPLQPRRASTAPPLLYRTHHPVLDLALHVKSQRSPQ